MRLKVLAPIVFLLVLLTGCRRQGSSTVFIDPALAALVPGDTVMLAGVRMEQLGKTKFWTDYVQKGRVPAIEKFQKTTGLNVEKDLWELLVASTTKDILV